MPPSSIKIKNLCEEVFDNYDILDFGIEGKDVVLKVKRKQNLQDALKKLDSFLETVLNWYCRSPIQNA